MIFWERHSFSFYSSTFVGIVGQVTRCTVKIPTDLELAIVFNQFLFLRFVGQVIICVI